MQELKVDERTIILYGQSLGSAAACFVAAKSEVNTDQRNRILEECRSLMREALQEAIANPNGNSPLIDSKQPTELVASTLPHHNE